jgi:hypothetical protein
VAAPYYASPDTQAAPRKRVWQARMVLVVGARLLEARRLVVVVGARHRGPRMALLRALRRADRPVVAGLLRPGELRPVAVGVRPPAPAAVAGVRLKAEAGDNSRSDSRPADRCTTARFNRRAAAAAG